MKTLSWAILALTLLLSVVLGGLQSIRSRLEPMDESAGSQLFEISAGEGFGRVAARLEKAGLIRSASTTKLLAQYERVDGRLHVGEYELSASQSTREILDRLTAGRVKTWRVTIPEGSRASEIAGRLGTAELADPSAFMDAIADPDLVARFEIPGSTLEGYLYPDTYSLPRGLGAKEIASTMVKRFENVWQQEIGRNGLSSDLSKHEAVTLASIVEKETADAAERPLIAAVFLNRLAQGMRLETDPTVIYGIADFDGNLRHRHLADDTNPYNTYRIHGLPPGPIANPGIDAMRAVASPADSPFLYFVSRNNGTHQFSETYSEHARAVDHFQKRRRPRHSLDKE